MNITQVLQLFATHYSCCISLFTFNLQSNLWTELLKKKKSILDLCLEMHEKNSELITVLQGLGLYFLDKLPLSAISMKKAKSCTD